MLFFLISILAGVLTVLAPCILPLLPIVIGTSTDESNKRSISRRSLVVIGSLAASVFVFTLLLKATTLFITIPNSFWAYFSGTVIIVMGLLLLFPALLTKVPLVNKLQQSSNKLVGTGYQKKSFTGDALIGIALGPVFSTCSPTYLFIIATALPASLIEGLVYLFGFIIGLSASLLAIAYFGQQLINALIARMGTAETIKQLFAGLIILVGIAIFTGYDKQFEAWVLNSGYGATIDFENNLIDRFGRDTDEATNNIQNTNETNAAVAIPAYLQRIFPNTDWTQVDSDLANAMSGGPGKDGIPSIDDPTFVPISEFTRGDDVPAIFVADGDTTKVYPYNILNWHEIVNDTVNGEPVAITFCPLCGSAIAFKRTIDGEVTTLGVSGSLLESNMIMYDRATESLWQQSTGEALAGEHFGTQLELFSMQLATVGEIRTMHPDAVVLSEDTGHFRQYGRDPYEGYTENDRFIFDPSNLNRTYNPKELFMAFRAGSEVIAVQQSTFGEKTEMVSVENETYTITRDGSVFSVTNEAGEEQPIYFEMWFSLAIQNGEDVLVVE